METEVSEAEMEKKVKEILADPHNEQKPEYKDMFAKAKELGLTKGESETDPLLDEIRRQYGNGWTTKEEFFADYDFLKNGGAVKNVLATLPEDILTAIEKHSRGESYETPGSVNVIDFSKSYSEDELLRMYYPNTFNEEELAEADNVAVKKAKTIAKKSFLIEKQERANERILKDSQRQTQERYAKETLETTLLDLRNKVKLQQPNISNSKLATIEATMRSKLTSRDFLNRFIDDRGGFVKEAASNLYPLIYQEDFTGVWKSVGREEGERAAKELIERGGGVRDFHRQSPTSVKDNKVGSIFSEDRINPFIKK